MLYNNNRLLDLAFDVNGDLDFIEQKTYSKRGSIIYLILTCVYVFSSVLIVYSHKEVLESFYPISSHIMFYIMCFTFVIVIIIQLSFVILAYTKHHFYSRTIEHIKSIYRVIYQILVFIYVIYVLVVVAQYSQLNYDKNKFIDNKEFDAFVEKSQYLFCSEVCPCSYNVDRFKDQSVLIGRVLNTQSDQVINVQSCQGYDVEGNQGMIDYMKMLELYESCSGWKIQYNIYVFSNINRGNTYRKCQQEYQSYYLLFQLFCFVFLFLGQNVFITGWNQFERNRLRKLQNIFKSHFTQQNII